MITVLVPAAQAVDTLYTNTNILSGWITNTGATNWNPAAGNTNLVWDSTNDATNSEAVFTNTNGSFALSSTNVYLNYISVAPTNSSTFQIGTNVGNGTLTFVGTNAGFGLLAGANTLTIDSSVALGTNIIVGSAATIVFSGVISGAGSLTVLGSGTTDLNGANSNSLSGGVLVNAGTLLLDYSSVTSQTNLINTNDLLTLAGGTLVLKGKSSGSSGQTFGSPTLTAAGSQILINPNGGTGTTLVLGNITNSAATGAALLVGALNSTNTGTVTITTTAAPDSSGIYDPMLVFTTNGSGTAVSWASSASGSAPYTLSGSNPSTALITSGSTATNYLMSVATTLTAGETINSLYISNSSGNLNLGGFILTNNSGGFLISGANGGAITNGTIIAGANYGYNVIFQDYATTAWTNAAVISNNGSSAVSLTKAGSGTLVLSASNAYTSNTYVSGGNLSVTNGGVINTPNATLTVGSGTLALGGTGTITVADLVVTNGNGLYATNSVFKFNGGTLNTTNASNSIASTLLIPSNTTTSFGINGIWNMQGGTNFIISTAIGTSAGNNIIIGSGVNNAEVVVNSGATWVLGNVGLNAGTGAGTATAIANNQLYAGGSATTNNELLVNGGIVTNVYEVFVGGNGAASNDQLVITNGGQVAVVTTNVSGSGGIGLMVQGTNSSLLIGSTNGTNSVLNMGNSRLEFNANVGGSIIVGSGGVVTNATFFAYSAAGTLTITNGGIWGASNGVGGLQVGRGGSSNDVLIGSSTGTNSVVNVGGNVYLGGNNTTASSTNLLVVGQGGILTSIASGLWIGGYTSTDSNNIGNQMIVTNGGFVSNNATVATYLGYFSNDNSNSIIVAGTNSTNGANSIWSAGGANLSIGYETGTYTFIITNMLMHKAPSFGKI